MTDLLTIREAAARLGIHETTAYRMVREGQLPGAVRVSPHRWKVSAPLLERYLHGDLAQTSTAARAAAPLAPAAGSSPPSGGPGRGGES